MNATLEVLQSVVREVVRMSWQGSLLVLLILIATAAARGRITARWRYLLCCVAMVRLLLPLLPQTQTSLFNVVAWESTAMENRVATGVLTNHSDDEMPRLAESPESNGFPNTDLQDAETHLRPSPAQEHGSASGPSLLPESTLVMNPETAVVPTPLLSSLSPLLLGGYVWLIGVCVVLARTVKQLWHDRQLLRRCLPASAELISRATAIAMHMKLQRSICLLVSPDQAGPAVAGFFRPKVVLPSGLLQSLPVEQLELVLRHELTHIQRGDVLVRWLMTVVRAVHWFNPVVRVGLNTMQRDCELACDESVLSQLLPERRNDYGHTLLAVVENSAGVPSTPLLIGMTKDGRHLQRRIEMIREFRPSARRQSIVALLAVFLLGVCGLTDAVQPSSVDETSVPDIADEVAKEEPQDAPTKPTSADQSAAATQDIELEAHFVDPAAEPIPGVKVLVYRLEQAINSGIREPKVIKELETNESGIAKIRVSRHGPDSVPATDNNILLVGRKAAYADAVMPFFPEHQISIRDCQMTKETGSLRGQVTDESGKPVSGVTASYPFFMGPIPGVQSAITDENGHYEITNLACWKSADSDTFDEATGTGSRGHKRSVQFTHPNYPKQMAWHTGIPEELNYQLECGAIVDGMVRDEVTGKPVFGAVVSAQSTSTNGTGWAQVSTAGDGSYRLLLPEDSYNIWAESPDRVAIAIDSLEIKAGEQTKGRDIHMVPGSIVRGTLRSSADGPPSGSNGKTLLHVAHHGPARPRSGAAVASALVKADGTYELRVAPGDNYIYLMHSGDNSAITLHTEEGKFYDLDFDGIQPAPKDEAVDAQRPNVAASIRRPRAVSAVSTVSPSYAFPRLIEATPAAGSTDVDPNLTEIRVTFDRDMGEGMSWTGGGPEFPGDESQTAKWIDKRTCVLPVKLKQAAYYRVGINSKSYQNFKAADGTATPPTVIFFTTKGASQDLQNRVLIPEVVEISPTNDEENVPTSTTELSVTFNMPMGKGMSWTGGGDAFPKTPDGAEAKWSEDGLTCTLPVTLEPNHEYKLGLNSLSHNNFRSEWGVPLKPMLYTFRTASEAK